MPAERALARAFNWSSGKLRFVRQPTNSAPTAPVAPTMATVGLCILFSTGNKKAPDLSAGLRISRCVRCYARTSPKARSGLVVFVARLDIVFIGADPIVDGGPSSTGKAW